MTMEQHVYVSLVTLFYLSLLLTNLLFLTTNSLSTKLLLHNALLPSCRRLYSYHKKKLVYKV